MQRPCRWNQRQHRRPWCCKSLHGGQGECGNARSRASHMPLCAIVQAIRRFREHGLVLEEVDGIATTRMYQWYEVRIEVISISPCQKANSYQNMPDFVPKACDCSAPITLEPCRADYQKAGSNSGWFGCPLREVILPTLFGQLSQSQLLSAF